MILREPALFRLPMTSPVHLSEKDVLELDLASAKILDSVEQGLLAHWKNEASSEDTITYKPLADQGNLLSIIRGTLKSANLAMIKTVGTFPDNPATGLPPNPGLLTLIDATTGIPKASIDAATITTLRTAAVTALGAKYLARKDSGILGCIGSRGIALQATRFIAEQFDLDEIRLYSPQEKNRNAAVATLAESTGSNIVACNSWKECLDDADIMIDGSSLTHNQELFPLSALNPGTTLILYGYYCAMPPGASSRFDRLIMDRWGHDNFGALGPLVANGEISSDNVDAMIGGVISGDQAGRQADEDCLVFWHRGIAACDIVLAQLLLEKTRQS